MGSEEEGLDREKRRAGGAKRERVPVPVLRLREGQCDLCVTGCVGG